MRKAAAIYNGSFLSALDKIPKILYNDRAACWTVEAAVCPLTEHMRTVRSEFMEKAGAKYTMYAVILTGGKQLKVEEGSVIRVEKLAAEVGETVTFDRVAAVGDESGLMIGAPLVDGASVTATVLANGKGKKIRVFTYKPKCGQKRAKGHRQPFTQVRIESISK